MPGLISSAAPGRKAAPKAPARRRPAPAATVSSARTTPNIAHSIALPSPPPTQLVPAVALSTQDTAAPATDLAEPIPTRPTQLDRSQSESLVQNATDPPVIAPIDPETTHARTELNGVGIDDGQQAQHHSGNEQATVVELGGNDTACEHASGEELAHRDSTIDSGLQRPAGLLATEEPIYLSSVLEAETGDVALGADQQQDVDNGELEPSVTAVLETSLPSKLDRPQSLVQTRRGRQTAESRLAQYNVQSKQLGEENTPSEPPNGHVRKPTKKRVRVDPNANDSSHPTKRAKRTSTRSNAKTQAIAQGEGPTSQLPSGNPTDNDTAVDPIQTQRTTRRTRRSTNTPGKGKKTPKSAATVAILDEGREGVQHTATSAEANSEDIEPEPALNVQKRPKRRSKQRRQEPLLDDERQSQSGDEDPELHEVDPKTLSMWSLSYDSRHGKTSEREKAMAEIDWDKIARERREAAELIATGQRSAPADGVMQSVEGADGTATDTRLGASREQQDIMAEQHAEGDDSQSLVPNGGTSQGRQDKPAEAEEGPNGVNRSDHEENADDNVVEENNVTLVIDADGNIQVDEESLRIDRGAQVEAALNSGKPIEEVNDLTVQINRTTWMNNNRREPTDRVPAWKWKSDPWAEDETDRFYEALRMFGTDFFIISKMFPPKTRRMIKAKFNREERLDPQRINDALSGKSTRPMNLEHYSQQTGRDVSVYQQYDGYDHAQQIIQAAMKEKEDAMTTTIQQEAAAAEEKAEQERQAKKEKKEKGKRGKGKKSKSRGGGTMGGGPEEVTVE